MACRYSTQEASHSELTRFSPDCSIVQAVLTLRTCEALSNVVISLLFKTDSQGMFRFADKSRIYDFLICLLDELLVHNAMMLGEEVIDQLLLACAGAEV